MNISPPLAGRTPRPMVPGRLVRTPADFVPGGAPAGHVADPAGCPKCRVQRRRRIWSKIRPSVSSIVIQLTVALLTALAILLAHLIWGVL
jgi:hypothetical protein